MTSDQRGDRLANTAKRAAQTVYWAFSALGILFVFGAVFIALAERPELRLSGAMIMLSLALASWLIGRGVLYIVAGR